MLHEIPDIRLDARLTHVLCSLVSELLIADLIRTVLSDSINFIQNDLRLVDKARTTTWLGEHGAPRWMNVLPVNDG